MSKILYFTGEWCNPCKILAPTMEKSGLPYQKIDIDIDTELLVKYGVRSVPTLIKVDASGNVISRLVGNNPLEKIQSWYNG